MRRSFLLLALAACAPPASPPCDPTEAPSSPSASPAEAAAPTPADADALVARYNEEGFRISLEAGKAAWVRQTHITLDTQFLESKASERWLTFQKGILADSKAFVGMDLRGDTARALQLIRTGATMPAPPEATQVGELATLSTDLDSMYGAGEYCRNGECRDLEQLMEVMAKSRDPKALEDAWTGWRTVAPPMRDKYLRFVELMNAGAKDLGFADTGALWRSGYDMSAEAFYAESERLWTQVEPLYEQLHCYVRAKLRDHYGAKVVPEKGPIPAHLLGNMWGQEWNNIYELVRPHPTQGAADIDEALERQKYDAVKMVKSAESFYTSMGLKPLPKTFWERSMFVQPEDRKVVCHASAWDVDAPDGDLRIKMCIDPTEEDLVTIYHELGHIYYYLYYKDLPFVFQRGAHDGFHEAIGDALTLSMTPAFYEKMGLGNKPRENEKAIINQQLKDALEKIAFLPFGKLVDQWRWDVFSGKIPAGQLNQGWWALRTKYQGIAPPSPRDESHFDPGAKYHIPANTPYTRYFLARILQFQFHQALCEAAGHEGPLHSCSIHGSKEAGERLASMLSLGQSQPWPDALEKIAGTRQMDASAIIAYFQPLMTWLKKENEGRTCGW